jgi:hypothetical protein
MLFRCFNMSLRCFDMPLRCFDMFFRCLIWYALDVLMCDTFLYAFQMFKYVFEMFWYAFGWFLCAFEMFWYAFDWFLFAFQTCWYAFEMFWWVTNYMIYMINWNECLFRIVKTWQPTNGLKCVWMCFQRCLFGLFGRINTAKSQVVRWKSLEKAQIVGYTWGIHTSADTVDSWISSGKRHFMSH